MLFDGVPEPDGGVLRPDRSRPGNGLELKRRGRGPLQRSRSLEVTTLSLAHAAEPKDSLTVGASQRPPRPRIEGEVRFDPGSRATLLDRRLELPPCPHRRRHPAALDDLDVTMAAAATRGADLLRGGGTSLAGQAATPRS